jgi:histidinol phosphatase-like enzyme
VDAIYAATAAPPAAGEPEHPDRKPQAGMLLRAAADLKLDLSKSWLIGDSHRDMVAGKRARCRGCILVRTGHPVDQAAIAEACHVVDDVLAAARHIHAACGFAIER